MSSIHKTSYYYLGLRMSELVALASMLLEAPHDPRTKDLADRLIAALTEVATDHAEWCSK